MGRAMFYHLTRSSPEGLVPRLIARAMDQGWRVELRGSDPAALERLDARLWQEEGFLAHGRAGGPHDARQPVLLRLMGRDEAEAAPPVNGAAYILSLDGAPIAPEAAAGAERACIVFDGNDQGALDVARGQWRALTKAGVAAEYWSEKDGSWRKETSSDGA